MTVAVTEKTLLAFTGTTCTPSGATAERVYLMLPLPIRLKSAPSIPVSGLAETPSICVGGGRADRGLLPRGGIAFNGAGGAMLGLFFWLLPTWVVAGPAMSWIASILGARPASRAQRCCTVCGGGGR